jgi:hypothetical protein
MRKILIPAVLGLAITLPAVAVAAAPMLLNYQGHLAAPDGTPKNGTFAMQFSVYDAASGGNQLPTGTPWSETQNVTVTAGVFNVLLGSVTALPTSLFEGGPTDAAGPLRFLNVVVDGETLDPRKRIGSAAYAIGSTGFGATAWVNFDGVGSATINDSFNVASVVRNGTGNYTVTWATPFANASYAVSGIPGNTNDTKNTLRIVSMTASSVNVYATNVNGTLSDVSPVSLIAVGRQ